MGDQSKNTLKTDDKIVRRDFLKLSAGLSIVAMVGIYPSSSDGKGAVPISLGYLVVDTKKCQGCLTCMLSCSIAHEGRENLSLARIQVTQNPFEGFPDDITIEQCRQCATPKCLEICPTGALHADPDYGNVRTVNEEECSGCMKCVKVCPYIPSRAIWNFEENHAQKCDLCARAQYFGEKGGPGGKQACVEVCPVGAIAFITKLPQQSGDAGYEVNLRGEGWAKLGYPID